MPKWNFLTNHALVLIFVYEHPRSTLREIAHAVGITERAALTILRQLEEEWIVSRSREGRRNRYTVDVRAALTHPLPGPYTIRQIVVALANLLQELREEDEREEEPAEERPEEGGPDEEPPEEAPRS